MKNKFLVLSKESLSSSIEAIKSAVYIALETGSGNGNADLLSLSFSIDENNFNLTNLRVFCFFIGGAKHGELVRIHIDINNDHLSGYDFSRVMKSIIKNIKSFLDQKNLYIEQNSDGLSVLSR